MDSQSKIKVLHVVTRMNTGGVAVLLDNLMSGLTSHNCEAMLVTGKCEAPESEYLSGRNINYRITTVDNFHKSLDLVDDIRSFIKLCRLILKFQPNIIHTHTSKAGLFGRIAGILVKTNAKRIHTFHGHLFFGYFGRTKLILVKMVERILALISNGLIAMGSQVCQDLIDAKIAPQEKFEIVLPGLRQPSFPQRENARISIGLDSHKIYCIYIGRLTHVKRPDRLLEVASITQLSNPDLEYLVVGDGELADSLKEIVSAKKLPVKFMGWRSDIPTLLAASDMLILTSDNEAVALTLIEASQAGIPIVTTGAGSVRDIALDGKNGYVTDFQAKSLAEAVLRLAGNQPLRNQMGTTGALLARESFSVNQMVQSHLNFYKKILKE